MRVLFVLLFVFLFGMFSGEVLAGKAPTTKVGGARAGASGEQARSWDHRDLRLGFIGWSAGGDEYGFSIKEDRYAPDGEVTTKRFIHIRKIVARGRSEDVVLKTPVKHYLVNKGYTKEVLKSKRLDEMTTRFPLGPRRHLTFHLLLGKTLSWQLSIFDGEHSYVLKRGTLTDVFTTVEPLIFPSPDKRKFILLIRASSPYRIRDKLELILHQLD